MAETSRGTRAGTVPTALAIRNAAVELFYRQGFEATSQRQLADAVGLQVASLYNHIKSKEQLLASIMKDVMEQLIAATERAVQAAATPEERLLVFMGEGIRFHAEHRLEALVGNTELRSLSDGNRETVIELRDRYEHLLESILKECVRNGSVQVPDTKMAAFAGVAICVHVASWYRENGRLPLDEVIGSLLAAYAPTATLERA
ncbi:TetR/AcrR family transcriptional regulator [Nonomuraea sp. NPDC048916]|uniref:TetR/AcrR family transcriptional regulator n=1 Tax=Nonomuraea sp. NPDC048916 TaxID=3154232 RepID=UPI0033C72292